MIAASADGPAQPQAGGDHQRHGHPDDAALRRDAHFIGLHVAQVARLGDLRVVDRFGMLARSFEPGADGVGLEAKGMFAGNERTAPTDQGDTNEMTISAAAVRRRGKMVPVRAPKVLSQTRQWSRRSCWLCPPLFPCPRWPLAGQATLGHHTACGFMGPPVWFITQDCP